MNKSLFPWAGILICAHAHGASLAGTALIVKGNVMQRTGGQNVPLREGDRVAEGSFISTSADGYVKLLMADQSQLSLGPSSVMRVEAVSKGSPAAVDVYKGQLRSKVLKDLMGSKGDELKTKFIVRTKSATMGVRGTDFQVVYNPDNKITSLVTFEGGVAMVRNDPESPSSARQAEVADQMLRSDRAIVVTEGNYSAANPTLPEPTIPTKLSPAQFDAMKGSEPLPGAAGASATTAATSKEKSVSPIPPGVDSRTFMSNGAALEKQLAANVGRETLAAAVQKEIPRAPAAGFGNVPPPPPPEGFYDKKSGAFAPPAGGFLDLKTGLYIPPPPGSTFDPNTGVYVPPPNFGGVDPKSGNYVPPAGFQLDPVKGFVPAAAPPSAGGKQSPAVTPVSGTARPGVASVAPSIPSALLPGAQPMAGMPLFPPPPPPLFPGQQNPVSSTNPLTNPTSTPTSTPTHFPETYVPPAPNGADPSCPECPTTVTPAPVPETSTKIRINVSVGS